MWPLCSEEDLNAKNSGGYTPLMYAAYIGHDNIVNMLIDAQVDVNLSNDKGHTPLMLAASCGNESVCDFLKDVRLNYQHIIVVLMYIIVLQCLGY